MQLLNCVIWEPQADGVKRVFFNNNPVTFSVNDYLIEHSLIHLADCTYNGVNPCGEGMIYEEWPDFISTDGNTLRCYPNFPGENKGSNVVVDTFGLTKDFEGQYRICDNDVDMGAYETQFNCTVGTSTPDFAALPINIKILHNPIQSGTPIMAQISTAATALNLRLLLTDIQGRIVWQDRKFAPTYFPDILSIDAGTLQPGMYLLHIMDESGRSKVEKVVVVG